MERLGPSEIKLLAWAQNRGVSVVRTGDLVKAFRISPKQEARLLANTSKKRLITKIVRGLYLLPRTLPAGGVYVPSSYLVLEALMTQAKVTGYQISGLVAFNSYGLETQIPNQIDVYNDKLSGWKTIGGQRFRFIKVPKDRLGDTKVFNVKENEKKTIATPYSSLPRAVFDGIYDSEKFGTLPKAFDWLIERMGDSQFMGAFLKIVLKLGNDSTMKRVGCILERAGYRGAALKVLYKEASGSQVIVPLIPKRKRQGKRDAKWRVIINEDY